MAERMHLLQQQEHARRLTFDGRPSPCRRRDSLPPPTEDSQQPRPCNAIERAMLAGVALEDIESAFGVSHSTLQEIRHRLLNPKPAEPAPKPAQADRNAVFNGASADKLQAHVARSSESTRTRAALARIPVAEAGFAAPAPVPVRARADAPRTHVLDWAQRMSAYAYTPAPDGCIPRKSKLAKGRRGLTHQQLNEAFYASPASGEINAKPQAQQRQRPRAGAHPSTNPFSEG